jgi:hypothetical protein
MYRESYYYEFYKILQLEIIPIPIEILWLIDPLLGRDLETNNETTAFAIQQFSKFASTTIELLLQMALCNPLIGSCNSWTRATETRVFSMWSVPRS